MPVLDVPNLASERVLLRPLAPEDSHGMFSLWSNADVCRYAGPAIDSDGNPITLPAPSTLESGKILEFWLRRRRAGTGFRWAVLAEPSRTFVGAAGFNTLGACSDYAYHLHPDHWGRGLMYEASGLALGWLFSDRHRGAAEAFIERDNVRSVRLAERLGFRLTDASADGADRYVLLRTRDPDPPRRTVRGQA